MNRLALDIDQTAAEIIRQRNQIPPERSLLVGISGIDGSGKGFVTGQIVTRLQQQGHTAAGLNVDGWLNLPARRFNPANPAEHFYEHALRFEEMFAQLILPLKANRSVDLIADHVEETATVYRPHHYHFENLDIILLEGIFLFKQAYRSHFDSTFWVECSFETALERALQRAQEGLQPKETIQAYRTIYFPAQEIHFARDNPRDSADFIVYNDPRLN